MEGIGIADGGRPNPCTTASAMTLRRCPPDARPDGVRSRDRFGAWQMEPTGARSTRNAAMATLHAAAGCRRDVLRPRRVGDWRSEAAVGGWPALAGWRAHHCRHERWGAVDQPSRTTRRSTSGRGTTAPRETSASTRSTSSTALPADRPLLLKVSPRCSEGPPVDVGEVASPATASSSARR